MDTIPEKAHCVGVAGAGMLPLAICLSQKGHCVTAEDNNLTGEARKYLNEYGVRILDTPDFDKGGGVVIKSSAVGEDHPSLKMANASGWPILLRGECLSILAKEKRLIAIAGSHGKSTTCGMMIDLFSYLKMEASYVLGAVFDRKRPPGRWDESPWLIAEIDESDGTIENFHPEVAVVLNADLDHHSRYSNPDEYLAVFERLARRTGSLFIGPESLRDSLGHEVDESTKAIWLEDFPGRDWQSKGLAASFSSLRMLFEDGSWERVLNRSGRFNLANAVFAITATAELAGINNLPNCIEFSDLKRRQSCNYLSPKLRVVDDYAHHPTEIDALFESLEIEENEELVVVFQPHRFSRTAILKEAFAASLSKAGVLYLLDIYAAGEESHDPDLDQSFFETCSSKGIECGRFAGIDSLVTDLAAKSETSEVLLLFLGAGDTHQLASEFSDRFAKRDGKWGPLYRGLGKVAEIHSRIVSQEPLAAKTTLRVGGSAELFFEPSSRRELQAVFKICRQKSLPIFSLGRGSNLVVPDQGVEGLVIRLSHPIWKQCEGLDAERVRVGAGVRIKELCGYAARNGLKGFEFLEGIPGSIGGALRMNAGAMGGWMFDVVESVTFLTSDGEMVTRLSSELTIGYRRCDELVDAIAIEAVLRSVESGYDENDIRRSIDVYQKKRKETQPRDPSAGCIFKNPDQDSAGRIIEALGLKGAAIGGAEISSAHGNFIVNKGGANSQDVIELVKLVRREALDRMQVELEPEALLYGMEWTDALR